MLTLQLHKNLQFWLFAVNDCKVGKRNVLKRERYVLKCARTVLKCETHVLHVIRPLYHYCSVNGRWYNCQIMNSLHPEWKPCAIMLRIQNEITDVIFLPRVSTSSLTQTWPHKPHEQRANGVQVLCVQILRKCVHVRLHQRLPSKLNIEKMYKIWKIRSWEIRKEKEELISGMR